MFGRSWVPWCISGVVGALLVSSCGDSSGGSAATLPSGGAETQAAGAGAGDESGSTRGGAEHAGGQSGATGTPDATTAGEGGAAGAPSTPSDTQVWLGLHCEEDADCGDAGLHCLRANQDYADGSGAPAGGLCTRDCEEDADCRAFDPSAVCGTLDEPPVTLGQPAAAAPRLCLQGCWFGQPTGVDKCHGQLDQACRPFAPKAPVNCDSPDSSCPDGTFCFRGFCREAACGPRCNIDADCSAGRVCNPGSGLCDEQAPPATPIGADCPGDQDPESSVCGSGTCLLLHTDGVTLLRMCTQTCTLGRLCGDDGACVLPRFESSAAGDIAYCMQRCDCDADCKHPGERCYEWFSPTFVTRFQSQGVCDVAEDGYETLSSCGEGGAGGAGAGGASAGGASAGGG